MVIHDYVITCLICIVLSGNHGNCILTLNMLKKKMCLLTLLYILTMSSMLLLGEFAYKVKLLLNKYRHGRDEKCK